MWPLQKGRRALDDLVVVLNALCRSVGQEEALKDTLDLIRGDLVTLRGHLDKELVIDIADGHYHADAQRCDRCALLQSIPKRMTEATNEIVHEDYSISMSRENWSVVFPGRKYM